MPQLLREAVLGQNAVCPSQLKGAFHQGIVDLKMPVEYADYAGAIHNYMADLLEIGVPVMGSTIPRSPCRGWHFPPLFACTCPYSCCNCFVLIFLYFQQQAQATGWSSTRWTEPTFLLQYFLSVIIMLCLDYSPWSLTAPTLKVGS